MYNPVSDFIRPALQKAHTASGSDSREAALSDLDQSPCLRNSRRTGPISLIISGEYVHLARPVDCIEYNSDHSTTLPGRVRRSRAQPSSRSRVRYDHPPPPRPGVAGLGLGGDQNPHPPVPVISSSHWIANITRIDQLLTDPAPVTRRLSRAGPATLPRPIPCL
jgi:hypothetical protein